mmetsp:Transcript_56343/g.104220  ORF Transcript_56343/g.104220 Transcript_56343/m.104220 type:complete len:200 (+) Transcript_56343:703-1302(+)
MRLAVHQQVLWLYVSVTYANGMYVCASSAHLVAVELHKDVRDWLLHLVVVLHHSVHCVRAILHHYVQKRLASLLSVGVESMFQLHNIRMPQFLHDLQLAVLVPLVLKDLLDGHRLTRLNNLCLVNDAKGAASKHALSVVGEGSVLSTSFLRGRVEVVLHGTHIITSRHGRRCGCRHSLPEEQGVRWWPSWAYKTGSDKA